MKRTSLIALSLALAALAGCDHLLGGGRRGANLPAVDRPFPVGQYNDAFWETQQTNAEAADFIFYDHEFRGNTAELGPAAKKHLEQVALRLEHTPFPVVIEQSQHNAYPEVDQARRRTIIEQLGRLGVLNAEERIVIANAFPEGLTEQESEQSYYNGVLPGSFGGGAGRRFGGYGGVYR